MKYNLADLNDPNSLTKCRHPEDNITIADRSVIFLNGIDTIIFTFYTKNSIEKIFLSSVCYHNKLYIKLISLKMLDRKDLSFFFSGILKA